MPTTWQYPFRFGPRSGGKPVHALPLQRKRASEATGAQAGLWGVGNYDRQSNTGSSCRI